ncbi:MAG: CARDB domain-containing protein [Candidatus Micrarchaeota archaeon]
MNKWFAVFAFALFALFIAPDALAATGPSSASGGGVNAKVDEQTGVTEPAVAQLLVNPNKYFSLQFQQGWNLFSVPVHTPYMGSAAFATVLKTDCTERAFYYYDSNSKTYIKEGTLAAGASLGATKGYWYKSDGSCTVSIYGSEILEPVERLLSAGWNQIGAPYKAVSFEEIKGTCEVISGPYKFNTNAYQWEKAKLLSPGEGYFVKAKDSCIIGSGGPPKPPDTSPVPTIIIDNWPDLGIKDLEFIPANPAAGENFAVYAIIYNYGSAGGYLDSSSISFSVVGVVNTGAAGSGAGSASESGSGIYIAPGGYYKLKFSQALYTSGLYEARVKVQGRNDYNRGNDEYFEYFTIGGGRPTSTPRGFDPVAQDITFSNNYPAAGYSVDVAGVIYNRGPEGGYLNSINLDFSGGGEGVNVGGGTGASVGGSIYLAPGSYYYLKGTNTFPTGGWWAGTLKFSASGDADTSNNYYAEKIYVKPASTPTATATPDCTYSGDGTYSIKPGCTIKANDGSKVMLKEVSQYEVADAALKNYLVANFQLTDSSGTIVQYNYYLSDGSDAYPFGEGKLYLKVEGISTLLSYPVQYVVKVTVRSGGTPTSTPGGFDLGVQDLVFSNSNPKVGESFTITAMLYNYGDVGGYLKSHSISFESGSGGVGSAVPGPSSAIYIGPKQYYKLQFSQSLYTEGNWKVTVGITPSEDINPANDKLSETIYVGGATPTVTAIPGKPDLTIGTTGTKDNLVGSIAKLPFTVYNYGSAKSPATTVLVTGDILSQSFAVPELLPGDSYWDTLSFAITDKPLIALTLMVDPYNYISESEETNNKFSYTIYPVASSTPTPEANIILHRTVRDCNTDKQVGLEQVFEVGGSTGYTNYKCTSRKAEQCNFADPYASYYDEVCEYPSSIGGGGGSGGP